jgi:outer membrane immunogenic protein
VNASASLPPYNAPLCLFRDLFLIFVSSQPHFTIKAAPLSRDRLLDLEALCTFALRSVSLGVESMWNLSKRILGAALAGVVGFGSANAADMYAAGGSMKDPVYVAPTWTGFYLGAHAGGAWSSLDVKDVNDYNNRLTSSFSPSGAFGGAQFGFNFQKSRFVYGVEVDLGAMDLSGAHTLVGSPGGDTKAYLDTGVYGDVTARLAYAFGPALIYAKGGFAFTDQSAQVFDRCVTGACGGGLLTSSTSDTLSGYTIGGGIEYMVTPAWSIKGEYQYFDYGSYTVSSFSPGGTKFSFNEDFTVNTFKVGLNYHFTKDYEPMK